MSSPTVSSDLLPPSDPIKSVVDSPAPSHDSTSQTPDNPDHQILPPPPPLRKYTRPQLVALSASPLVMPPANMPELKVWFGSENDNATKKDDSPTPNTARERRFRRDADDGDTTGRPSFRTTLSQPSQMGNFKHQSLRSSDRDRERDRDRDGEKERERDIRDKDTHERLRHISEKYDRDRLALPLSTARKERETAPHLNASTTRTAPVLSSNAASRRADTREAAKKKVGEASEDWRRGAEPRSAREDRVENGRREDRDRVRDSSRPKREVSVARKDRDEPRDKNQRGDRDRDEQRRDKDRDGEPDEDPRRWRDDGKRDERLASRRERGRDKPNPDHNWEGSADKRWTGVDDRGFKRSSARDRKPGNATDDLKERDDRRDREREKEKEPAWMDTYVPNEATPGILGGQSSTGELDGIQAWKKGLKESKDKEVILSMSAKETPLEQPLVPSSSTEKPAMDEIALFKLMMRKEEQKKNGDLDDLQPKRDIIPNPSSKIEDASNLVSQRNQTAVEDSLSKLFLTRKPEELRSHAQSASMEPPAPSMEPPPSFPPGMKDNLVPAKSTLDASQDRSYPQGRGLTNLGSSDLSQPPPSLQAGDSGAVSNSFQPPPGSRLLAFARPGVKGSNSSQPANGALQGLNGGLPPGLPDAAHLYVKNESPRPQPGFSPFDEQSRQQFGYEESREINIPIALHANSRIALEQNFNPNPNAQLETNHNGVPAGKGSRFAKFFDVKTRDNVPSSGKHQIPGGFTSPSPTHGSRQEHGPLIQGNQGDQRAAMDELFAMLNSSSQRGNMVPLSNPLHNNNGAFGAPGPNIHTLQQQHLQQSQQLHSNRLEPLYDSRSEDRSFVPDGMVPGLRPIPPPPPRGRDAHFPEHVDESIHYGFQRMPPQHNQQPQIRNLEPLYPGPGPIFAQQGGRPQAGINLQNLQQPHYRGGPSPTSNQGGPISNGQQLLPPGLANLGGRPPHEPAQFMGMNSLPSSRPHNALHANSQLPPQQLPFNNNFNAGSNIGFNGIQVRGPVPGPHLHNSGAQQLSLGNNGLPNMDLRLSNHHQLMGLGGSGVSGNRVNGGFAQGPAPPSHLAMRSQQQQQQQQQQQHLPHMLPHLMSGHLQQGHPNSNNQSHDLMALLMGGPQRE